MKLKRTFLISVLTSLSLAAVAAIGTMALGDFNDLQMRVIMSTLTVALFSLTSLLAALALEKKVWRIAMDTAFAISGVGLIFYLGVIWLEVKLWQSEWVGTAMWWLGIWAVALPQAALLAIARFPGAMRYVRLLAICSVLLFAASLTMLPLLQLISEYLFNTRYLGDFGTVIATCVTVAGILAALGSIAVPVLYKVREIDKLAAVVSTSLRLEIACPRCLTRQTVDNGHSRCCQCRLKFRIEIEEPRCPKCDYLLHKLVDPVCPECGQALGDIEVAAGTTPTTGTAGAATG